MQSHSSEALIILALGVRLPGNANLPIGAFGFMYLTPSRGEAFRPALRRHSEASVAAHVLRPNVRDAFRCAASFDVSNVAVRIATRAPES